MKTLISLPAKFYKQGESTARELKISRSRLYARALREFLDRHKADGITQKLNEVYSREPAEIDPGLYQAQLQAIAKDRW